MATDKPESKMGTSNSDQNENGQVPSSSALDREQEKLNAVRDLLFGQNVQEYRGEFEELKRIINDEKKLNQQSILDLKNELVNRINDLEEKLSGTIENLKLDLTTKISQIDDSKADRKKMAAVLHELASKLEE